MNETYSKSYEEFDLKVELGEEGELDIKFSWGSANGIGMGWATFLDVYEFIQRHAFEPPIDRSLLASSRVGLEPHGDEPR